MANILPLDAQKKIWHLYRARFIIAASLVSLALSVLAAIALVPGYLTLQLAAPPVNDTVIHQQASTPADVNMITHAQALITAVAPLVSATSSPSTAILAALSLRPAGVVVTHITYVADKSEITLAGSASRDAISAYRDALSKNPLFTGVSIPVGALIGADNNFTMSLSGKF